jgi:predicted porin
MNAMRFAIVTLSACAGMAHAQAPDAPYRLAEPAAHGAEASFLVPGKRGTISLGLFEGASEGPGVRLFEYVDSDVERQVGNFTRETLRRNTLFDSRDARRFERRNRAWGMSLGFQAGPLALRVAHQNKNVARVAPATQIGNTMEAKNSIVAANVNIGAAKVYAAYSANRGWGSSPLWNPDNPYSAALMATPSTDSRDLMTGIAIPYGATTLLASYIRKNDRDLANRDTRQFGFGASHAMSRRTDFFAAYSHTTNIGGAGLAIGRRNGAGAGVSAINIGMRHSF